MLLNDTHFLPSKEKQRKNKAFCFLRYQKNKKQKQNKKKWESYHQFM